MLNLKQNCLRTSEIVKNFFSIKCLSWFLLLFIFVFNYTFHGPTFSTCSIPYIYNSFIIRSFFIFFRTLNDDCNSKRAFWMWNTFPIGFTGAMGFLHRENTVYLYLPHQHWRLNCNLDTDHLQLQFIKQLLFLSTEISSKIFTNRLQLESFYFQLFNIYNKDELEQKTDHKWPQLDYV